jgi:hypothetical protein
MGAKRAFRMIILQLLQSRERISKPSNVLDIDICLRRVRALKPVLSLLTFFSISRARM